MNHLIAMAGMIESANLARQGSNLFLLTMPADVNDAIMLRGPIAGDPVSSEMPGVVQTEFLVVLRHVDPIEAHKRLLQISKLLTVHNKRIAKDVYVTSCEPETRPIAYPRNQSGLLEWAVRFSILFSLSE